MKDSNRTCDFAEAAALRTSARAARVERIRQLAREGLPAGAIAQRLSCGRTLVWRVMRGMGLGGRRDSLLPDGLPVHGG